MLNRNSTTLFSINGDTAPKTFRKLYTLLYFTLNRLNNSFPLSYVSPHLQLKELKIDWNNWSISQDMDSPSRRLSNLFWYSVNWNAIANELQSVRILDIGCGKGHYSKKILPYLPQSTTYKGIDIYEDSEWKMYKTPQVSFSKYDGVNIDHYFSEKPNFIMSQSSLEHIRDDYLILKKIANYIKTQKFPVIQVHMLPSPECLYLYGLHGYRQYTPRKISAISKIFSSFSECQLYKLGGSHLNNIHKKYIPWNGEDLRSSNAHQYIQDLKESFRKEMQFSSPYHQANFFALTIHSNSKNKIF